MRRSLVNKTLLAGALLLAFTAASADSASAEGNTSYQTVKPVAGMSVVFEQFVENAGDNLSESVKTVRVDETPNPYSTLAVAVCQSYVNVRSLPSTDGTILGKIYNGCAAEILEEADGWYKMQSGNLTGYIKAEYFVTGEEASRLAEKLERKIGTVTASALRVRKERSTESKILTMIPKGEEYVILYEDEEWAQVEIDSTKGWVFKEYLDIRVDFDTAVTLEEEKAKKAEQEAARKRAEEAKRKADEAARLAKEAKEVMETQTGYEGMGESEIALREAIVAYALQFVGNKYVYGGNSLTEGTDCSGFVKLIYKEFGYSLQRRASLQYRDGVKIDWEDALPGDLIFYGDDEVDHVTMYIGNGKVVHASNPATGIKVSTINYRRAYGAVRVIE